MAQTGRKPFTTLDVQPPMPLRLSDAELEAVLAAARPLDVRVRDAFLVDVAQALSAHAVLGPGVVGRTCAEVQKRYFDPPDFSSPPGARRKYG